MWQYERATGGQKEGGVLGRENLTEVRQDFMGGGGAGGKEREPEGSDIWNGEGDC